MLPLKDADDQEWEMDVYGFGRTFPHKFKAKRSKTFTTFLTLSPAGDEILLDFSKTLIEKEALGQDNTPDYLSVSFSATDYVGAKPPSGSAGYVLEEVFSQQNGI